MAAGQTNICQFYIAQVSKFLVQPHHFLWVGRMYKRWPRSVHRAQSRLSRPAVQLQLSTFSPPLSSVRILSVAHFLILTVATK